MKDTACLLHGAPPGVIYRCGKTGARYGEAIDLLALGGKPSPPEMT